MITLLHGHPSLQKINKPREHEESSNTSIGQSQSAASTNDETKSKRKSTKHKSSSSSNSMVAESAPGPSGVQQAITSLTNDQQPLQSGVEEDDEINKDDSVSKENKRKTKRPQTEHCPKCGRGFTSKKRLLQSHYNEETQTCRRELEADKECSCTSCGKLFSNMVDLQGHYDEESNSCRSKVTSVRANHNPALSDNVNVALATHKISEQELYAVISEVMLQCASPTP